MIPEPRPQDTAGSKMPGGWDVLESDINVTFIFKIQSWDGRGEERERDVFYPLVHFPKSYNSQHWATPNPGAGSFNQVS